MNQNIPENLPGIDFACGLRMCNSNGTLYLKMLHKFRDSRRGEADEIRRLISAGEVEEATRIAHSMKSVAGVLGATELSAAARLLEEALSKGLDDKLQERLDEYGCLIALVICGLDAAFDVAEAAPDTQNPLSSPEFDSEFLLEMINKIESCLDTDMVQAINLVSDLGAKLRRADLKALYDEIQRNLALFEIDAVHHLLRQLSAKVTEINKNHAN